MVMIMVVMTMVMMVMSRHFFDQVIIMVINFGRVVHQTGHIFHGFF